MIYLPDVKMPKNCHECDALDISDVVGLKCPCEIDKALYDFNGRPETCPLKEQEAYKIKAVTTESLISALDSVTWYNGLAEIIVKWKDEGYFVNDGYSLCWNWNTFNNYDKSMRDQLEIIWMICVELFGDCGTSPRSGWIELENKDSFYQFIDDITETYRDYRRQNEDDVANHELL